MFPDPESARPSPLRRIGKALDTTIRLATLGEYGLEGATDGDARGLNCPASGSRSRSEHPRWRHAKGPAGAKRPGDATGAREINWTDTTCRAPAMRSPTGRARPARAVR